jgi:uncharacterized protein YbcI
VTVPPSEQGPLLAEVTNAIVHLYRTHYGKGPTRSKSYLMDDLLVCVMRDVLTTIERTLIEAGEAQQVRATRLALREAVEEEIKAEVERIVGCGVRGFTGRVLVAPEIAIEVCVLESRKADGRASASLLRREHAHLRAALAVGVVEQVELFA